MAHPHRKLTPFGRYLLVQRIMELGWTVSAAAASAGVSRETAYKWLRRWQHAGTEGLQDRSARPHTSPRCTPPATVQRLRRRRKLGPHRLGPLLGVARSTVYAILRREGLSRLRDADRTTGIPIRYVREHPGELIHLDMRLLARIPAGGGHRMLGRSPHTRALPKWLHHYNHDRPHTALGGQTPAARSVNNVYGNHRWRGRPSPIPPFA
ncbi:MAG TPA: leucine zipper domain-containing protein [bacterium]|nr:leucine zipper domain-containing protein [bacterium]